MAKSVFVEQLDAIQQTASKRLKRLGFRKGGRSFNRLLDRGIVQVITFQMGEFPIGNYVIPGIRESLYGSFAVNLGVLLPCVYHADYRFPLPKTIRDGHCSIRDRLKNACGEEWFKLGSGDLGDFVDRQLETVGLLFLDTFKSYEAVLDFYTTHGKLPFQNEGRATLEAALICKELGDLKKAHELFAKAVETNHKAFRSYVSEVARRFGYEVG